MPDYLNVDRTGSALNVPPSDRLNLPGQWVALLFDHEISDAAGHHSGTDPALVCAGPRYCHGVVDLWLVDFDLQTEIQVRSFEVDASGNRVETHLPHEFYTSAIDSATDADGNPLYPRTTHHRYPVTAYVNSGHRLGIEVSQWPHDFANAATGHIDKCQAQLNMWT